MRWGERLRRGAPGVVRAGSQARRGRWTVKMPNLRLTLPSIPRVKARGTRRGEMLTPVNFLQKQAGTGVANGRSRNGLQTCPVVATAHLSLVLRWSGSLVSRWDHDRKGERAPRDESHRAYPLMTGKE